MGANGLLSEALAFLNGAHLSPNGRLGNMVRRCHQAASASQAPSPEVEGTLKKVYVCVCVCIYYACIYIIARVSCDY